jgi:hypothetical protein
MFLADGTLRPLEQFDPVAHHRGADAAYVANFVFFPR